MWNWMTFDDWSSLLCGLQGISMNRDSERRAQLYLWRFLLIRLLCSLHAFFDIVDTTAVSKLVIY